MIHWTSSKDFFVDPHGRHEVMAVSYHSFLFYVFSLTVRRYIWKYIFKKLDKISNEGMVRLAE